jgi:hypothetical protein
MDINATIRKGYETADGKMKDTFGVNLSELAGNPIIAYKNSKPCFFLSREIGQDAEMLRAAGMYRHCKLNKDGRFYDYIADKFFNTLEEWVEDCNSSTRDVLFGYNKFDGRRSYISLIHLLTHIGPVFKTKADEEELAKFMRKLNLENLGLDHLLVVRRVTTIQPAREFMQE